MVESSCVFSRFDVKYLYPYFRRRVVSFCHFDQPQSRPPGERPENLVQALATRMGYDVDIAGTELNLDILAKLQGNVRDIRERLRLALQVLQLTIQQSTESKKIVNWTLLSDP